MTKNFEKWVSIWGNAVSIAENRPEGYARNITLRYPIYCPFDGDKVRITFDNYCGTEPIHISKATVLLNGCFTGLTFDGQEDVVIPAGERAVSDEAKILVQATDTLQVSMYFADFTQMRSAVYIQGPLSGGKYAIGDVTLCEEIDINVSRKTNIYYFISNVSLFTEKDNHALVCYGDSITAQDWPDYLAIKLRENGINNVSVVRRATSGSRILRQYSCITYESYGLMGRNRFDHEVPTDGADTVIIQQGINDIIHPVGVEVNPFRPMSDLPTIEELKNGMDWYIERAQSYGYKIYLGTLLPIEGWRTYADFREALKNDFNEYMRNHDNIDGVIDFDKALRNPDNPKAFKESYDSGDHLHPSAAGYERMAQEAFEKINFL